MAKRKRFSIWIALQYFAVFIFVMFLGFPFLWMFITSFKTPIELLELDQSIIPEGFYIQNYIDILEKRGLIRSAGNSVIVAFASTILTMIVAIPAG